MTTKMTKSYYLPATRSILLGIFFSLFLLALLFIGFMPEQSAWENFQSMVLDFRGLDVFVGSFLMLIVKLALLCNIIHYFRNARKIERARIDSKGFYYKGNIRSKYEWLTHETESLVFVEFSEILNVSITKNWLGEHIFLSTVKANEELIMLGVLAKKEKQEIVDTIKSRLNKQKI